MCLVLPEDDGSDSGDRIEEPYLNRFFEIAGANAPGAYAGLFHGTAFLYPDRLQIGKITPLGLVVRVTDVVPHHGAFAA